FVLSALIGRALGTEGLGAYAVAMAWVLPLSLVVEFGLSTLMQRDLAADLSATRSYLENVVLARLGIGGAIMLLLLVAAPLISADPQVIVGLRISAPLVIILPLFSTFTALYKAHGAMWPVPYLNIGMLVAQVLLTAASLVAGGGIVAVLILNVTTSAVQLAAAWLIYRWRFYTAAGEGLNLTPAILPILRRAFPFALAALFAALQTRLSVILLEQLATTAEVGYFSAAARFVEAARMIPNAFFGALFPALAALAADRLLMRQTFRRGMIGLSVFGVAAGVGFSLLALPLVSLTYGAEFSPAAPVLQVLGWSLLFSNLRGARTLYLYALGQERRVNWINGIVIVVQGGLSLLLIPAAGAFGVAIVHGVVEIIALVLLWNGNDSTSG
ncbi:MAG: oligosaccharide flippase family protein, partial [Chloroflexota bacterium]